MPQQQHHLQPQQQADPVLQATIFDVLTSLRVATAHARTTRDPHVVFLDPLAKELKENPALGNGLIIIARHNTGSQLWQVHNYSATSKVYSLTEVHSVAPITVTISPTELADCCTLDKDAAQTHFLQRNGQLKQFPLPQCILTIRLRPDITTGMHVYSFMHSTSDQVVQEVKIHPPTRAHHNRDPDDTRAGGRGTTRLSNAALAMTDLSRETLSDKTGERVVSDLRIMLSKVEKTEMGGTAALADTPTVLTMAAATKLLRWEVRDIADFRTATPEEADIAGQSKKATFTPASKDASVSLDDYYNLTVAIFRAFELTPGTPLVQALLRLPTEMVRFVKARQPVEPDLVSNGFCGLYLNHAIKDLAAVMANPDSTTAQITDVIQTLTVSTTTTHYEHAMLLVRKTDRDTVRQMQLQLQAIAGRTPKDSKTKPKSGRTTTPSQAKGSVICYQNLTTRGCQNPACHRSHTQKPTAEQKTAINAWLTSINAANSSKPPLTLDDTKL